MEQRWDAAFFAERPQGDSYGLGVGHIVLPSGQLIAVAQNDDETARALFLAAWDVWQEELNG